MRLVLAALLVAAAVTHARADDEKAPWVAGVSEEAKTAAKKLLAEGNELFLEHKYADALDRYRRAIARWDHPAIRFNAVRCLIQLDRPVEAAENLELALKYGAAPLEDAVYAEAIAYQKLLANQVGEVSVHCEQPGVAVSLDAEPLVQCPGSATKRIAPGRHVVIGTKQGFMTSKSDVVVIGGKRELVAVTLDAVSSRRGTVVHRWPAWAPWVVFGGGLAIAGSGALLEGLASARMSDYDRALVRDCAAAGCGPGHPIPAADAQLESSAHTYSTVGVVVISAGAAAAITGGVMLYLNRGQIVYRDVEIAPTHGGAAVTLTTTF
jgi:tetratricopeptide (TPR) repeat protein